MSLPNTIGAAIRQRWIDLGYDSSIAVLCLSKDSISGYGATPEEDAESDLPRAEFVIDGDEPTVHAVGFRVREATVTISVYSSDADDLANWLDSIETSFDNSDQAATDPVVINDDIGFVMSIQFSGREMMGLTKNVFLGVVTFQAMWNKTFNIPA